ncbi:MAG: excinuclease ABC subunit C [Erysipelotrichaceae bacterium]|nr:excinuclease ABC subunit C [Erysipelotrichaceae bacterium]
MKERIRLCIENLKHKPGVYLMHDIDDTIIYVGKAKDLYKRVSQYFLRPQVGKVAKMAETAEYFETIITENEKEALVLEMNLIHKYYPRFNIMLKDDSHYPYIAIKNKGDVYIQIKRNNKDKNYTYYGPFPNSTAAYQMVDLLNKIFPVRKCKTLPKTPCLYYHLGQCLAPCINKIDETTNNLLKEEILSFLNGNNSKQYQEIKSKMLKASNEMNYEMAGEYKKTLDAIDHINMNQNVENKDKTDRDIFAYATREGYLSLAIFTFRRGILLGKKSWVIEQFGDTQEQVTQLIEQYYTNHSLPKEIVINDEDIASELREIYDIEVESKSRGKIHDLVVSVIDNANNAIDEYFLSARLDDDKLAMLEELGTLLKIKTPLHIELFDNSHIQGFAPVGAMVAFVNGEPQKSLYRKFNIEHEESRDDLASMKEVVTRHYGRSKKENKKYPDLILADGGLIQVEAVTEALKEIEVDIPVFGLYKNDKHQTEGLIDVNGNTYPLTNKALFFLLTRMQDEVHRFAITFHRSKRDKKMKESILDNIKGLGEKRKEEIRKAYPDINTLKNASIHELSQFLPSDVAEALYLKLHQ